MSSGDAAPEAEAEAPLLDDVVKGSVDFNGRPSRRSRSGGWSSAAFIIGKVTNQLQEFQIYYQLFDLEPFSCLDQSWKWQRGLATTE